MQQFILRHESGVYLGQDASSGWVRTEDLEKALRLTCAKAQNVLRSNIRLEEQGQWSIVPETAATDSETAPALGSIDWDYLLSQTGEVYRSIQLYSKQLNRMHSEVDMEICDLMHYIEFSSLSAAKGYEAYRMLRDALQQRRQIKDENCRIGAFLAARSEDFLSGRVKKCFEGLSHREYAPRIRRDLFDAQQTFRLW